MLKFTSNLLDSTNIQSRKLAIEMNNKVKMECEAHPYEISVVSVNYDGNNNPQYKLESVCCDRFKPALESFIDTLKTA